MIRSALMTILFLITTLSHGYCQISLAIDARSAWETYLADSPRDQNTKDFLAHRVTSFIDNLKKLEQQNAAPGNTPQLEIKETVNQLKRDYQMLEATIQNLQSLSYATGADRTFDLNLMTSLGITLGQAKVFTNL